MSKELDRVRTSVSDALAEPRAGTPWKAPQGFFTFRYSSTEIFSEGGNLHVRMRETRYEDGRLKSEECEGTVDRQAYNRMMGEAQAYFLGQLAGFTRMLFAPLLSSSRDRQRDE
ncbi:hypothetical protein [Noviherbaspirillum denitrificans]|uniref:Uncharacterized protein n=1 Tax=Noviherbaspirillum denitrificans TaxID=1968433 RepID=A0A254TGH0_9BURK|nr:hypothetical protein [Noviherbaspirillum denitrificans]OWW18778.1 hypothetical protein AYR66_04245 [Noviherbaspirillum denitrificans]